MTEPDPLRRISLPSGWQAAYLDATPDALLVLDRKSGIVLGANLAVASLLGYLPDELPGLHFSALLPTQSAGPNTPLDRLFPPDDTVREAQQFRRYDGGEALCDACATPLGMLTALHLRDVRDREQRRQARDLADRAALDTAKTADVIREVDQYMSHVSHELRTPLAVILSSSSMLERYYTRLSDAKREEHFNRIQTQIKYLTEFLDNLRFLSRLNAGTVQTRRENAAVRPLLQEIFDEFVTDPQQPRFMLTLDGDLDEIVIDGALWRRTMLAVVQNAVRYGPSGGTVEVYAERRGDTLEARVTDHGPGLPEAYLARPFEVFRRGENARELHGGGVGLAIASRCAALMGGTLTFETESGVGTTFTLIVPAG